MLGLAQRLPKEYRTTFLSFAERGLARPFLDRVRQAGFDAVCLEHNVPYLRASIREIAGRLQSLRADVLCCSGYKPDVLGWRAARRAGVPVVSISHGWTAVTLKVRLNEALDRLVLRWMDRTVCVSQAQAEKVHKAGVPLERIIVIRNAIEPSSYERVDPIYEDKLRAFFRTPPRFIVGGAGRFSPEKGFEQLVLAAEQVVKKNPEIGFVLFGDGPLRSKLEQQITRLGLQDHVMLAGFRNDLEAYLPHLDLLVLSSFTEGLPVIILEAFASGVPVVATAVGGTPEVIEEGVTGFLVPPGDSRRLAERILEVFAREGRGREMGRLGREHVRKHFTFESQSVCYQRLFEELAGVTPPKSLIRLARIKEAATR